MDTVFFLVVIGCLVLVGGWYVVNEETGAGGAWGLLAVVEKTAKAVKAAGGRYRIKERPALDRATSALEPKKEAAFVRKDAGRRFADADEPRYRSRGPLPRYGERSPRKPSGN